MGEEGWEDRYQQDKWCQHYNIIQPFFLGVVFGGGALVSVSALDDEIPLHSLLVENHAT